MSPRPLSDAEKRDWLRLSRTENVGAITFKHLLARFHSAKAAIEALPEMAARGGKRTFKLPAMSVIDDEIARAEKAGA
ncbi:MAG TPA: DNA-protecting protein DprA, partial [Alphaproteobacteria bacterium]|nr:DNA-protecting protein DprA [Alphaproteobacteria bacterium]